MSHVLPSDLVRHIDKVFPAANKQALKEIRTWDLLVNHAGSVQGILTLVEQISPHLLTLGGDDRMQLQAALEQMRAALTHWHGNDKNYVLRETPGSGDLNPVTALRGLLLKCPDEGVIAAISPFTFILDPIFREALRLDLTSANEAFLHDEWKPSTVMAGSVLEAILLNALLTCHQNNPGAIPGVVKALLNAKRFRKDPGPDLESWHLPPMIEVAAELGLIPGNALDLCRVAKDFRNLIHPGCTLRLGQKCTRGTARAALAAVDLVIEHFELAAPAGAGNP